MLKINIGGLSQPFCVVTWIHSCTVEHVRCDPVTEQWSEQSSVTFPMHVCLMQFYKENQHQQYFPSSSEVWAVHWREGDRCSCSQSSKYRPPHQLAPAPAKHSRHASRCRDNNTAAQMTVAEKPPAVSLPKAPHLSFLHHVTPSS